MTQLKVAQKLDRLFDSTQKLSNQTCNVLALFNRIECQLNDNGQPVSNEKASFIAGGVTYQLAFGVLAGWDDERRFLILNSRGGIKPLANQVGEVQVAALTA